MNCDIYGNFVIPKKTDDSAFAAAYDVYGNAIPLAILLDENFDSFNTNVWSCRSGSYRDWQYLPEDYSNNAFCDNGNLIIRNLKNNPVPDFSWSGAFLQTQGKFQYQYGNILSRIKFPSDGNYYHATLWMLGENPGEIDIAEADSGRVSAAVHYYDRNRNLHSRLIGHYPVTADEWNIYELDWTEQKLIFKCNGSYFGSFNIEDATIDDYNSFRQPMYLVVNTNPYSTTESEYSSSESVTNYVDYIHVYGQTI